MRARTALNTENPLTRETENSETANIAVAIVDGGVANFISPVDEYHALTLAALVSEDPRSFEDMAMCWARYRTPLVVEWLDSLAVQRISLDALPHALSAVQQWLVVDLPQQRVLAGPGFKDLDAETLMVSDTNEQATYPVGFFPPPWWSIETNARPESSLARDSRSMARPQIDREVLYGRSLYAGLAKRVLKAFRVASPSEQVDESTDSQSHAITIEVHRDWLMSASHSLDGRCPRDLLHGAHDWLEKLEAFQVFRMHHGLPVVALPITVSGFETQAFSRGEVIYYFDLCRELIEQALKWCRQHIEISDAAFLNGRPEKKHLLQRQSQKLISHLSAVHQKWLQQPLEGEASAELLIEYARRRVPLAIGAEIVGISPLKTSDYVLDCDCPICNLMAEGKMGNSVLYSDGFHLELDDEFAFSLCSSREEWEEQRRAVDCREDPMEDFQADMPTTSAIELDIPDPTANNELNSAWPGIQSDVDWPGDPGSELKLAFLAANLVNDLECLDAPPTVTRELNERLIQFRRSDAQDLQNASQMLTQFLESLTSPFPSLTAKIVDFQSRIDEQQRRRRSQVSAN